MLNFEKKHISMYMCTYTLSHTHITKLVSQSTREHSAMGVGEVVGSRYWRSYTLFPHCSVTCLFFLGQGAVSRQTPKPKAKAVFPELCSVSFGNPFLQLPTFLSSQ